MGQIGSDSAVSAYAADYQRRTEQAGKNEKTNRVGGRTIGEPTLSRKASEYYEKLKAKYSNMEFILVSPDKKEEAERNKGMYQSPKELLVLIDSDKIERMAEDESYRKKYESILSGAMTQVGQMKQSLGANEDKVRSFGMSFDDHGNASFFAVVDKSLAAQRERIQEKRAEKKADAKAAAEKKAAARKEKEADRTGKKDNGTEASDRVTVTASSWEELLKKIDTVLYSQRADTILTEEEKKVGQSFDYAL